MMAEEIAPTIRKMSSFPIKENCRALQSIE
jgi:hypothetical protein